MCDYVGIFGRGYAIKDCDYVQISEVFVVLHRSVQPCSPTHWTRAIVHDASPYPLNGDRVRACVVHYGSRPVGWAAWLNTPMQNDKYFGNLHVVTILDCIAPPEYADIVAHLIADHVSESQADLQIGRAHV